MPGAVLTVHAAVGQAVAAGDPVVTLEAMKMEHVGGGHDRRPRRRTSSSGRPTR